MSSTLTKLLGHGYTLELAQVFSSSGRLMVGCDKSHVLIIWELVSSFVHSHHHVVVTSLFQLSNPLARPKKTATKIVIIFVSLFVDVLAMC